MSEEEGRVTPRRCHNCGTQIWQPPGWLPVLRSANRASSRAIAMTLGYSRQASHLHVVWLRRHGMIKRDGRARGGSRGVEASLWKRTAYGSQILSRWHRVGRKSFPRRGKGINVALGGRT